jgi:hypothetical protein
VEVIGRKPYRAIAAPRLWQPRFPHRAGLPTVKEMLAFPSHCIQLLVIMCAALRAAPILRLCQFVP